MSTRHQARKIPAGAAQRRWYGVCFRCRRGARGTMMRRARWMCFAVLLGLPSAGALLVGGCASGPQRESTGEILDDSVITSKVKTALFRDPDVSGFQVKVETYKGQVQLSGFVDTPRQKAKAEEIVRSVSGVRSVMNDIVVKR